MIFLSATQSLQVVLAGVKNTNDAPVITSYVDEPVGSNGIANAVGTTAQATTNGLTAVTLASGTAQQGYRRRIKSINLQNADLAAITVSIQIVDSAGPTTTVGQKYTIQTLENLNYEEGYGFDSIDANGATKSQAAASSSATSTADSKGVSAGTQASTNLSTATVQSSTTSSAVVSAASAISVADSKAVSDSVIISTNLSTFTTASGVTSSQLSLQTSAGTSVTLSKTKSSFAF